MPNIGNVTPDGQRIIDTTPPGQSLNSAFVDVNLNFDQVWATGLVNSNIQIDSNTIYTNNTNGDLVLNPNGIGNIVGNSHVVPDQTRVRNLGSPARYWNSLYTWSGDIQNATLGNASISNATIGNIGNLTIGIDNLHITGGTNGYVLQTDGTGNLTWTAQTGGSGNGSPGGANTQIQFNDAGSFGGTPNFTFNKNTSNISLAGNIISGNVYASAYYVGNTLFTRTLTVGRSTTPVTVPLASNNSFNVLTSTGNVTVYTT